jgi:hypothetical protein
VKIVALRTEYIVRERYINATGILNIIILVSCVKCRVLRRIFGRKKDKIIKAWRKLHKVELYNLYYPQNIIIIKSMG